MVVEGPCGCTLQVRATGNFPRCFSVSMFICGGPGAALGASHSDSTGGVDAGSEAEGIG